MKQVSFNPRVRVKKTLHLKEYSIPELRSTWYTSKEKSAIRNDIKVTVELIDSGADLSQSSNYCARGLESSTERGYRERTKNKTRALAFVLEEQEAQWATKGYCDSSELASAYLKVSARCQAAATLRGLGDVVHNDTFNEIIPTSNAFKAGGEQTTVSTVSNKESIASMIRLANSPVLRATSSRAA